MLTGKYPARLHITDWIPGLPPQNPKLAEVDWTKYLPLKEVTIAAALHPAGYASASIGKWHLGDEAVLAGQTRLRHQHRRHRSPVPKTYFAPYNIVDTPEGPRRGVSHRPFGHEAVRFINQHKDEPFFLYLPHFAVHLPDPGQAADYGEVPRQAAARPDANQRRLTPQ